MTEELIRIRSVKEYWNEFIVANKMDFSSPMRRAQLKMQLLDAFRKEVFDQIMNKFGPSVLKLSRDDMAGIEGVQNILKNEFRKWRRLCILCNDAGLVNWIVLEDLKKILEEEEAEDGHANGEVVDEGDTDGDEALIAAEPEVPFEPMKDEDGDLVPQEFPAGYWTGGRA